MEEILAKIQNRWGWIHLAHVQLSTVYKSLYSDIVLFVTQQSINIYERLSGLKELDVYQTIEKLKAYDGMQSLTWGQVEDISRDLQTIQETLTGIKPDVLERFKIDPNEMQTENSYVTQLRVAMEWLLGELKNNFVSDFSATVPLSLKILAKNNDLIRSITEKWVLYREAWEQRLLYKEAKENEEKFKERIDVWQTLWSTKWRDIMIGDRVVCDLYSFAQSKSLRFKCDEPPVVVPFMTRLYATGFGSPLPVIVTPYWGSRQVWTWLGYAHEIGHHVFRNVEGLQEALRVIIGTQLFLSGRSYEIQTLWFNWLEEVFADIVGLLLIGPAGARSMRWMLLYLPLEVIKKLDENAPRQDKHDYRSGLFRAADDTHPIPYLRARFAFKALEILGKVKGIDNSREIEALRGGWDAFFESTEGFQCEKKQVTAYVRQSDTKQKIFKPLQAEVIEEVGQMIIETILTTKLSALTDQNEPKNKAKPRSLCDVFFEDLEQDKVNAAGKAIQEGRATGQYNMRHLLAAVEEELEEQLEKQIIKNYKFQELVGMIGDSRIWKNLKGLVEGLLGPAFEEFSRRVFRAIGVEEERK